VSALLEEFRVAADAARIGQPVGDYRRRLGKIDKPILADSRGTNVLLEDLLAGQAALFSTISETRAILGSDDLLERYQPPEPDSTSAAEVRRPSRSPIWFLSYAHETHLAFDEFEGSSSNAFIERLRSIRGLLVAAKHGGVGRGGLGQQYDLWPPERFTEPVHAGLIAVDWIRDFLRVSRMRALEISGVASATFYSWKQSPTAEVRPKTIELLLRLKANIGLLIAAQGEDLARSFMTSEIGLLDRLAAGGEQSNEALAEILRRADSPMDVEALTMGSVHDILSHLDALEDSDQAEDLSPLGAARGVMDSSDDGVTE
jgi:hypothetical protein